MVAEQFEPVLDEVRQRGQRLFARDRPVEGVGRARVAGEARLDVGNHVAGDRVRFEAQWGRHQTGALAAEAAAVVGVEVPAAARRLATFHQHAMALAHHAVEELHAQLPVLLRPVGKAGARNHEMQVIAQVEHHPLTLAQRADGLFQPPFARLDQHQLARRVTAQPGGEDIDQILAVTVAQRAVIDRPATAAQHVGEMAHGRQEERRACLVAPDMGRFARRLDHQHPVAGRIETFESGRRVIELVAEHQHQVADFRHAGRPCDDRRQNSTSPPPSCCARRAARSCRGHRPHRVCSEESSCCPCVGISSLSSLS